MPWELAQPCVIVFVDNLRLPASGDVTYNSWLDLRDRRLADTVREGEKL